jgi:hypothetical protein
MREGIPLFVADFAAFMKVVSRSQGGKRGAK